MGMTGNPITKVYQADGVCTVNRAVMKGTADNEVKVTTGADVATIGIAQATTVDHDNVDVAISGTAVAIAAGAIAIGAKVTAADNVGKLKTAAPAGGANSNVIGMALTHADADGDEFLVLLAPSVMQGA